MPDVNYWAILLCGVASMVLGFLWYGALFGKMWQEMSGHNNIDPAKKAEMMKNVNKSYSLAFIGSLVMAYVLSHMIVFSQTWFKTEFIEAGLTTGFWVWLGFIAPVSLTSVLWEGKSWKLWGFNNAYNLVQLLIFGLILGSLR